MTLDPKKKKRRAIIGDSFIESLRDLGSSLAEGITEDIAKGIPETAFNQIAKKQRSGELRPNQVLDVKRFSQESERKEKTTQGFQQEFLDLHRQEKLVWTKARQETKLQIQAILEELKQLALSTKKLAKEVEVATEQAPIEPGTYHLSFFERLRQSIILFKKQVDESATWLATFNQKAKKRNYYWAQVRKSGTKFLLSQERYMATQAG